MKTRTLLNRISGYVALVATTLSCAPSFAQASTVRVLYTEANSPFQIQVDSVSEPNVEVLRRRMHEFRTNYLHTLLREAISNHAIVVPPGVSAEEFACSSRSDLRPEMGNQAFQCSLGNSVSYTAVVPVAYLTLDARLELNGLTGAFSNNLHIRARAIPLSEHIMRVNELTERQIEIAAGFVGLIRTSVIGTLWDGASHRLFEATLRETVIERRGTQLRRETSQH